MPFNWRDYLSLAQELSQRQDEAAIRSAISRAYYAALCSARLYLETQGKTISTMGADSHSQIWNAFQGKGKAANAVFQRGQSLKRHRQRADYENEVVSLSNDIIAAIKDAEMIFYWLDNLLASQVGTLTK